ncbi:MAG: hypothetical protein ABIA02_01765 [Candidatus Falkowbacteria bacterium]
MKGNNLVISILKIVIGAGLMYWLVSIDKLEIAIVLISALVISTMIRAEAIYKYQEKLEKEIKELKNKQ